MTRVFHLFVLSLLLWQANTSMADTPPMPAVSFVGYFTDIKTTGEHQYGSALILWQYKNTVVGFFYHADGVIGEVPRGVIDNVKLHPKSGKLSFDSTLPSQDRFVFNGTLRKAAITGQLQRYDALHPEQKTIDSKVTLQRDKQTTSESFDSLEAWQDFADKQLSKPAISK
jgi:hypothetical protein